MPICLQFSGFFFFFLRLIFWLWWVLIAARGLSPVVVRGNYSLWRAWASVAVASLVAEHRLQSL